MKNKLVFRHFLRRVGYYLSYPYPIWKESTKDTNWYIDTQSEFTINTAEQLAGLAKLVNNGNDFKGKRVKLGNDIVLNDIANMEDWENVPPKNVWIPIGTNNNPFRGTFDGDGHLVSGVYINSTSDNQGLFGCIEIEEAKPGWQIRNLWVIAFIVGRASIGGFTGQSRSKHNFSSIDNSYSAIMLTGYTDIGGFIGTSQKSKVYKSRSAGVVKILYEPKRCELVGNLNLDERSLSNFGCSNGIVLYQPNAIVCIKISDFERELFRQIRKRLNQLPHRSSKIWSRHYYGKINVRTKGNRIVIDNLLRNADVKIYNKHNQFMIYSGNSGNSCTLEILVQAGIYVVEVNKEKHPYPIKIE